MTNTSVWAGAVPVESETECAVVIALDTPTDARALAPLIEDTLSAAPASDEKEPIFIRTEPPPPLATIVESAGNCAQLEIELVRV